MKRALALAAAFVCAVALQSAFAQKYPAKPIRFISPFAPGGGTDILARAVAAPLSESFGQPIVVDNRPRAGGMTGAELVARAAPDGYSVIIVASTYASTSAYGKPSYDPVNGIEPIILIGTTGLVLTVHPSVPAKNVKELIDYAKTNPGKLNYASVGAGSVPHFAQELFRLETGIDVVHVPYKGAGPALVSLVAGEVQMTTISMVPILAHVKAGRLRALAFTHSRRSATMPDLPTIGETLPGFEVIHWYGLWGPRGMPRDIVSRWNGEVARILQTEEMKSRARAEGLEIAGGPPQAFADVVRRDIEKWRRVMKEAKIQREG
jgi:tripartite-type tricarboxylate transporter receptor subunit TctC